MKLYLTLEDGQLKTEKVMFIPTVEGDFGRYARAIEEMHDIITSIREDLKKEELILETRKLITSHE